MIWKKYYSVILSVFMIAALIIGCEKKVETAKEETGLTKEYQTAELYDDSDEDLESLNVKEFGDQQQYSIYPGDHVLRFSVRLPYSEGYDDVQFRVSQNNLDLLGINVEVENVDLETYFHPIWIVDAEEGFMGLQKELFTKINDEWVVSLSDVEATGRLSEKEIVRRLSNKKYHYMNSTTKKMEISSEELSVSQIDGESYIAHVDVRFQIPVGEYTIHRHDAYLEGIPAGSFQITVTQPANSGPIIVEGPNKKNPNE